MRIFLFLSVFSFSLIAYTQTWEEVAGLPDGASVRHHPISFSIAGTGYLLAGAKPFAGSLKDFYSYDPAADIWTRLSDFPGIARGYSYGVSSDTKGYIGFGYYQNEETFESVSLNDLWEYDPLSETWTELASCPCVERQHPAMVLIDNKIYTGLGENEFGDLNDWWEYDIETDTWTEKTDFPASERHHPYYFGIGDYVYVGFGHHETDIFNDFYRYDPSTDTWLELNNFPDQGRVAGTQFTYDGRGYILSGQDETHNNLPTGEFWEYNPDTDSWIELTEHPGEGRWAPGSFVIDSKVFLTCGQANTGEKKDMMVYDFAGPAGISEPQTEEMFVFGPNPTTGYICLSTNDFKEVSVFDAAGKLVFNQLITTNQINLSALESGIYIIELTGNNRIHTEKLKMN